MASSVVSDDNAGCAAKNSSIWCALCAPRPGTAAHHRRQRGTRTVRSASVRMPAFCRACAAHMRSLPPAAAAFFPWSSRPASYSEN